MNQKTLLPFLVCFSFVACEGEFIIESQNELPTPEPQAGADAGAADEPDEVPLEPADTSTARALFEANVQPLLAATCSPGGACHSLQDPAFVPSDPTAGYDTIVLHRDRLYPQNSPNDPIVTQGEGGHEGALYAPEDIAAISAWLAEEALEAAAGNGPSLSALAEWSGCMELDDWNGANVAEEWANKNADNQGDCEACHNLGADGFMASRDSERVFDTVTTSPAFMPAYFTLDALGTSVVINQSRFENVGTGQVPHQAHGAFDLDGEAHAALENFYDLTVARRDAGQCGPPRF